MKRSGISRTTTAALVAGAALAAGVVYAASIAPELEPRRFGTVVDGRIYRSGRTTPGGLARVVERYNIRTIVDFGAAPKGSPEDLREQRTAEALGVERHRFFLEGDARGDPNAYVEALRIMTDPSKQPVLVHCAAGTERTGCAVILYRTLFEGQGFERAMREAERFDHDPSDNPHVKGMFDQWSSQIAEAVRTGRRIPYVAPEGADHSLDR